jgi:CDP-4-dehydro-6-deoxyglucose reductase
LIAKKATSQQKDIRMLQDNLQNSKLLQYHTSSINQLTENHVQLWIEPIDKKLLYQAGQYLKIRYPNGEFFPFSMANAPTADHRIELHIRLANDTNTLQFIKNVKTTGQITITGPFGHSYFQKNNPLPIILLAAGTGFAPAKAIVEEIIRENAGRKIHLYWGVRELKDFYLASLPEIWKKDYRQFFYTAVISRPNIPLPPNVKTGQIIDLVTSDYPDLSDHQVFIFGPEQMVAMALKQFIRHGLTRDQIRSDML